MTAYYQEMAAIYTVRHTQAVLVNIPVLWWIKRCSSCSWVISVKRKDRSVHITAANSLNLKAATQTIKKTKVYFGNLIYIYIFFLRK